MKTVNILFAFITFAQSVWAEPQWMLTFGTGQTWHHQVALEGAVDQFFEGRTRGSSGGLGLGGSIVDSNGTRYTTDALAGLGLRLENRRALSEGTALVYGLTGELGRARYNLPEGIAPFIDPMAIRLQYLSLTPDIALSFPMRKGAGLQLEGRLGAGLSLLYSQVKIRSALIAVDRSETFTDPFAFAQLNIGHDRTRLQGQIRLRLSNASDPGIELGLAWPY